MASATRGVGTVKKGMSEKVAFKLRNTGAVGKRIFQTEGTVEKSLEHWRELNSGSRGWRTEGR